MKWLAGSVPIECENALLWSCEALNLSLLEPKQGLWWQDVGVQLEGFLFTKAFCNPSRHSWRDSGSGRQAPFGTARGGPAASDQTR